jgi:hypothetical protein
MAAGAMLGLWLRRPKRPADVHAGGPIAVADTPAAPVYEHMSRVVWSDDPHHWQGDLEDAENIELLVSGGWELVDVIVPFAQTNQLDLGYPGNTRKLIAYFRRPIAPEGEGHAE